MFKKLTEYQVEGGKVFFRFEGADEGVRPCLEMISEDIFNVFIDYNGMEIGRAHV